MGILRANRRTLTLVYKSCHSFRVFIRGLKVIDVSFCSVPEILTSSMEAHAPEIRSALMAYACRMTCSASLFGDKVVNLLASSASTNVEPVNRTCFCLDKRYSYTQGCHRF